jgi:3-dehydro-L-gulonate 2-dehydrogenase
MTRVPYQELYEEFLRVLLKYNFSEERAEISARLHAEASLDGFESHGLNRFPKYIADVEAGVIDVDAKPERVATFGGLERWDGNLGPGNLNAYYSMDRAINLAKEHGMGAVALRNTNHWQRGGAFGWQAAEAGTIGICWTNTMPNLPAWGAKEVRVGNNPLIIGIPKPDGHVVLDMAMSQFAWGTIESYRLKGKELPIHGGYDSDGNLTRDPAAIEESQRPLPIGYWKGSGLTMMMDMIGSLLSAGDATKDIGEYDIEQSISQFFLCFDLDSIAGQEFYEKKMTDIVDFVKSAEPAEDTDEVYYPGERTLLTRKENLEKGVPVDDGYWEKLRSM